MRRIRESGKIWADVLIIIAIVGIVAVIIGGKHADRTKKLFMAGEVNKNWEEKNCDYFAARAKEEAEKKEFEKIVLYLKLHEACLVQPKTPH